MSPLTCARDVKGGKCRSLLGMLGISAAPKYGEPRSRISISDATCPIGRY
jgi:hypothetical protein